MGLFDNIFGGGVYSLSPGDREKMTAKEGFIRYAFKYLGGHRKYPELYNIVAELSIVSASNQILNIYANTSAAGFSPSPGQIMLAIPIQSVFNVANTNKDEFSGGAMIGGLGAILQETRYILTIDYVDDQGFKQTVRFGSTEVIKSESYFKEFVKHLNSCMEEHNTKALEPDQVVKDNDDIVVQLEKLSALKEKGVLTEEEFSKAKSKLLEEM